MTFSFDPFSIIRGDAIEVLKQLQNKVDCVITSPPYYQQRSYGASTNELGREPSVAEYISNLVGIFKAIPLNPWGSIWVNIGDKRISGISQDSTHRLTSFNSLTGITLAPESNRIVRDGVDVASQPKKFANGLAT
jgi:DNA modification methylase